MTRNEIIDLLEAYTKFLQKNGYLDTDATCEEPTAIEQFLGTKVAVILPDLNTVKPVNNK